MADVAGPEEGNVKKRVVIIRRKGGEGEAEGGIGKRGFIVGLGCLLVLGLGLGIGYRVAQIFLPTPPLTSDGVALRTERVYGGIYALELSRPEGKARWMLEFDADIVTKEGPTNPIELRNALEKLVIDSTSLPLVQTSLEPEVAARAAMLAMAKQDFPWLVEIHLKRSEIRDAQAKLQEMGRAMRGD